MDETEIHKELMQNELTILEKTSHPNVMRIYELLNDDKFFFVISEYIKHGELYDFIVKREGITEDEVVKIVRQIFLAINYMH